MTKEQDLFLKHEKLIYSLAWSYAPMLRMRVDDLISLGRAEFWEVVSKYKPSRGKFSTFLYECIKNKFLLEAKRELQRPFLYSRPIDTASIRRKALNRLGSLSKDACQVVHIILESAEDVGLTFSEGVREARRKLRAYLQGRGWGINRTLRAMREVKENM